MLQTSYQIPLFFTLHYTKNVCVMITVLFKCIQAENCSEDAIAHTHTHTQVTRTVQARRRGLKGVVGVAGGAVELQATPRRALDGLRGAVTDGPLWQEIRVVVVDKVAEDAAIRERHGEVFHLHRQTRHFICVLF